MLLYVHRNGVGLSGTGAQDGHLCFHTVPERHGQTVLVVVVECCLPSTETHGLFKDGEKGNESMEVGEEGDYIPIATLSQPE